MKSFWIRRWFRTLPLYWLMLVVNCVFWHYFPIYCWNADPVNISWKHLLFIQNYDPVAIGFFPESWSLCVEEWFYLSVPIILMILLHINKHIFRNILAVVTLVVVIRCVYVLYSGDDLQWDYGVRKNIFLRMDALGIGVLLAYISLYREKWFSKLSSVYNLFIGVSGVAIIACIYMSSRSVVEGVFAKTVMFDMITISWGLVMCYLYHVKIQNNLVIKVFTGISKISYSLYLVHFPIFIYATWYTSNIDNLLIKSVICLIAWITAFMIAYVTYKFYEFPMMNLRDRIKFNNIGASCIIQNR
ncbi:MAG: acyltransferase [Selenomonadaceae bacterium]|nr:acyltransferase [Selenomonadaceae bacterium]